MYINVVDYQVRPINNFESDDNKVLLNNTQIKIIELIRNNPNINSNQIINKTGYAHSTISKNVIKLQEMNIIKRVGSKKKGYWEVIEHN